MEAKMKGRLKILAVALSAFILGGCVAEVGYVVPEPPPPREEVIGIAPFGGAVWVPGYWGWHRRYRRYDWHRGYWNRHR
jgi:hypothetical protein